MGQPHEEYVEEWKSQRDYLCGSMFQLLDDATYASVIFYGISGIPSSWPFPLQFEGDLPAHRAKILAEAAANNPVILPVASNVTQACLHMREVVRDYMSPVRDINVSS